MNSPRTHSSAMFLSTSVILLAFSATGSAQTLKNKLSQRVAFVPHSSFMLDQLVEISQQFKIPMGIEIDEDGSETDNKTPAPSTSSQRTVQELIDHILQRTPGYETEQNAGVLNIAKPTLAASRKNFLNISIP